MKNFIEVFDNLLTTEECKFVVDYMNQEGVSAPGKITVEEGLAVDKERKDSYDTSLNFLNNLSCYPTFTSNEKNVKIKDIILPNLVKGLQRYVDIHSQIKYGIAPWTITSSYNLQKYNPGQGYHAKHCENSDPSTSNRVLAWMFYLNTITDDGGTYFDNYDLTLDAKEGRLVLWPAYWTHLHKGIKSKTETKYIATGWCEYVG